ncbi:MAG: DUF4062 domain-containing protein [Verrucomicrobia bacterium]|nr:DUF4062 domain-containing protein [Verrucomicrobiota bacterium]
MKKLRIFVSSVQKELEIERVAVAGWVSADPQLSELCDVVLFEKEALSGKRISKPYLECLKSCQIYLLILDCEYGNPPEFSATHEEYRFARDHDLPMLVFVKGMKDGKREGKTKEFFAEIKSDGNTYRRFHDRIDLQPEIQSALSCVLRESFDIDLVAEAGGAAVLEPASMFEQQALELSANELDEETSSEWVRALGGTESSVSGRDLLNILRQKGLVRLEEGDFRIQASGLIFLGKNPSLRFPQCRIFVDAFRGTVTDSTPSDQDTLSAPAPAMVRAVWEFVQKNTRHPMRVAGLTRIALDEYPEEAVREAVVNAIAHRNYEDRARQILVKLFTDRLEILSPGEPMKPLTVAKIRRGNCQPCSRNPILGQYLNHLRLMDQRGSGISRMKAAMLNHGLDAPVYDLTEGYFRVILKGPGDDLARLRIPSGASAGIPPAVEEQLNGRQKAALQEVLESGSVSSGWLVKKARVSYDTANRDLIGLAGLKVLVRQGKGRASRYVLAETEGRE